MHAEWLKRGLSRKKPYPSGVRARMPKRWGFLHGRPLQPTRAQLNLSRSPPPCRNRVIEAEPDCGRFAENFSARCSNCRCTWFGLLQYKRRSWCDLEKTESATVDDEQLPFGDLQKGAHEVRPAKARSLATVERDKQRKEWWKVAANGGCIGEIGPAGLLSLVCGLQRGEGSAADSGFII